MERTRDRNEIKYMKPGDEVGGRFLIHYNHGYHILWGAD